jgi:hypothetical protein
MMSLLKGKSEGFSQIIFNEKKEIMVEKEESS